MTSVLQHVADNHNRILSSSASCYSSIVSYTRHLHLPSYLSDVFRQVRMWCLLDLPVLCCRYSERSNTKCIGITIETRPDYCLKKHLRYVCLILSLETSHMCLKLGDWHWFRLQFSFFCQTDNKLNHDFELSYSKDTGMTAKNVSSAYSAQAFWDTLLPVVCSFDSEIRILSCFLLSVCYISKTVA